MSNVILTHDMLVQRLLFELKNQLMFTKYVYKGYKDEFHSVGGFKKGSSVRVKLPNKYRTVSGAAISVVDAQDTETTVTVDTQEHVALQFTAQELTLDLDRFARIHLVPAAIALANKVDADGLEEVLNIYNTVGTAGTNPSTYEFIALAALRMNQEAVPNNSRYAVMSPKAHFGLTSGELKGVFEQNIIRELIRENDFGRYGGFDFSFDQNVINHLTGTNDDKLDGSTVTVKTTSSEGDTTISLEGFTASTGTLTKGTVFTIAAVVGVNPVSGQSWEDGTLRQFVVTADTTADGSGFMLTLPIDPVIISSSATSTTILPQQTVVTLPQQSAVVTGYTQTDETNFSQNIFYHPEAFACTMIPFERPDSAGQSIKWAQATDEDLGLSITLTSQFNISTYKEIHRADILYGWDTIRPELAVRGTG